MITREQALTLLEQEGQEQNLLHHALQTETVMVALAERLDQDPTLWGLTGLLHDLDYARTKDSPEEHGLASSRILKGLIPEEGLHAIQAHNGERNGVYPESILDFALRCGESVTGLVSANALVRPQGMEGMKPKSLKKKMKEKAFAASVSRENIRECEKLGLELGDFFAIAIDAMSAAGERIGLP